MEASQVSADEVDATLRELLLADANLNVRARKLISDEGADRQTVVREYERALELSGDPSRGREIFRVQCTSCHQLHGDGHDVGPDLAAIHGKSKQQLLESILDPNRQVDPEFVQYTIRTTDGRVLDGILAAVTHSSINILRAGGESETLLRSNVESMITNGSSPMPDRLETTISIEQMADLLVFLLRPAPTQARNDFDFRAGTAKVRITPETMSWLLCYDRHQKAEGVEAELWARALALEDSRGRRVVLVNAEILGFPPSLSRAIRAEARKRYGLEDGQLLLSASHTHNGPVLPERLSLEIYHNFSEEEAKPVFQYAKTLQGKIIDVIGQSLEQLQPATLAWARSQASFGLNRRRSFNPDGPTDPDVPVMVVRRPDSSPIATVFTYACHCTTVMADTCFTYHGDYAGIAASELERRMPGVMAIFVAGCGGDINPHPRGTLDLVRQHGHTLADAVEKTFHRLHPVAGPIRFAFQEVSLPLEVPPTAAVWQQYAQHEDASQSRHAQQMLKQLEGGKLPSELPFPIIVWQFGSDLTLIALSGETCVDYALRLKRELGSDNTWVVGYASEVPCYIPSERVLGEGGYEAGWSQQFGRRVAAGSLSLYGWPTPFRPGLESLIVDTVKGLVSMSEREPK
jgi:putative heme-binding domain-containing protein